MVDDVDAVVEQLKSLGVRFEEYDSPSLKTLDSVADLGYGSRTPRATCWGSASWHPHPDPPRNTSIARVTARALGRWARLGP
jgi:hypothetical protein